MQLEIAKLDIAFNYAILAARLGENGAEETKAMESQIDDVVRFAAEDIANDVFGQEYVKSMGLTIEHRVKTFGTEKGVFTRGWVELPRVDMNEGFFVYLRSYWEGMVGRDVALYTTRTDTRPADRFFCGQWQGYFSTDDDIFA